MNVSFEDSFTDYLNNTTIFCPHSPTIWIWKYILQTTRRDSAGLPSSNTCDGFCYFLFYLLGTFLRYRFHFLTKNIVCSFLTFYGTLWENCVFNTSFGKFCLIPDIFYDSDCISMVKVQPYNKAIKNNNK